VVKIVIGKWLRQGADQKIHDAIAQKSEFV
jgi:hypothetical protein